ncbi:MULTISPECIES: hypothetical protein [unclassified Inquilinus]|uniref:hypothetical protein n=1 Tax=unclassified Inquilinus TaxID=2645927 RepID=UPI003F931653
MVLLSACVSQPPKPLVPQPGTPPFQAIAPAGYCLSDESDPLAPRVYRTIGQVAQPGSQILATFRPCAEIGPEPGSAKPWHKVRLVFETRLMTSAGDRQVYLAIMANPKLTDLLNQRVVPGLRDQIPDALKKSTTVSDLRYLGSDQDAVYDGFEMTSRGLPPAMTVTTRSVSGQTVIGRYTLAVTAFSLTGNNAPEDWDFLQKLVVQAVHATIIATERPGTALPPVPPRVLPAAPGASGLTT